MWQLDKGDRPNSSGLVTPGEFETPHENILERRVLVSSSSFLRGGRCNIPENPYWFLNSSLSSSPPLPDLLDSEEDFLAGGIANKR